MLELCASYAWKAAHQWRSTALDQPAPRPRNVAFFVAVAVCGNDDDLHGCQKAASLRRAV